jgi:hypothetical protein
VFSIDEYISSQIDTIGVGDGGDGGGGGGTPIKTV